MESRGRSLSLTEKVTLNRRKWPIGLRVMPCFTCVAGHGRNSCGPVIALVVLSLGPRAVLISTALHSCQLLEAIEPSSEPTYGWNTLSLGLSRRRILMFKSSSCRWWHHHRHRPWPIPWPIFGLPCHRATRPCGHLLTIPFGPAISACLRLANCAGLQWRDQHGPQIMGLIDARWNSAL